MIFNVQAQIELVHPHYHNWAKIAVMPIGVNLPFFELFKSVLRQSDGPLVVMVLYYFFESFYGLFGIPIASVDMFQDDLISDPNLFVVYLSEMPSLRSFYLTSTIALSSSG